MKKAIGAKHERPFTFYSNGVKYEYPYYDSIQDLPIYVLREDIDNALPGNPTYCVMANAAKRLWGDAVHVSVDIATIIKNINVNGELIDVAMKYRLGSKINKAVKKFDEKNPAAFVANTAYLLKAISPSQYPDARAAYSKNRMKEIREGTLVPGERKKKIKRRKTNTDRAAIKASFSNP